MNSNVPTHYYLLLEKKKIKNSIDKKNIFNENSFLKEPTTIDKNLDTISGSKNFQISQLRMIFLSCELLPRIKRVEGVTIITSGIFSKS